MVSIWKQWGEGKEDKRKFDKLDVRNKVFVISYFLASMYFDLLSHYFFEAMYSKLSEGKNKDPYLDGKSLEEFKREVAEFVIGDFGMSDELIHDILDSVYCEMKPINQRNGAGYFDVLARYITHYMIEQSENGDYPKLRGILKDLDEDIKKRGINDKEDK